MESDPGRSNWKIEFYPARFKAKLSLARIEKFGVNASFTFCPRRISILWLVEIKHFMTLAAYFNHNGIGFDFDATEMDATGRSYNVTLIASGKSVIVDNYKSVIHRAGKPLDHKRRYIAHPGGGGGSKFIGADGILEKWIATFQGICRKNESGMDYIGCVGLRRRRSFSGEDHYTSDDEKNCY
jgi:hypothetical protein